LDPADDFFAEHPATEAASDEEVTPAAEPAEEGDGLHEAPPPGPFDQDFEASGPYEAPTEFVPRPLEPVDEAAVEDAPPAAPEPPAEAGEPAPPIEPAEPPEPAGRPEPLDAHEPAAPPEPAEEAADPGATQA